MKAVLRRLRHSGRRNGTRSLAYRAALLTSALLWQLPAYAATELPRTGEELVATLRGAIESRDYERIEALVNWEGAGTIKRRVVAFQIRHGLGRPIREIVLEPIPEDGLDAALAGVGLRPNMELSERVRVIYAEPPLEASGKPPASVFLVGRQEDGTYRIGLAVRSFDEDDDD